MKKQIVIISSVICFLLTGCATSITKRGMLTDNIYYSTHDPNIQIEISPDFTYHKGKTGQSKHQFLNNRDRKFIFIDYYQSKGPETRIDYYTPSRIFTDIPNQLDSGTISISGKKWRFCDHIDQSSSGNSTLIRDIALFTQSHDWLFVRFVKGLPSTDWDKQDIENFRADFSKDIKITNYEIGEDIEQSAKATDQLKEKQKLISTPETAPTIKVTDQPKEKPKVASIPKDVSADRVSLRKKPMKMTEIKITDMLLEYDFFERSRNMAGTFVNDFVDNNDGTVTDKTTGLMWQKSGSSSSLENRGAKEFIKQLNRKRFAGHSDWRMPTLEELASLLIRSRKSGVHIALAFESHQSSCWSADKCGVPQDVYVGYWIVNFKQGQILKGIFQKWPGTGSDFNWPSVKNKTNYVKAVRSVI